MTMTIKCPADFLSCARGQGLFIRAVGCCDDYINSIKQLDSGMSGSGRRITAFAPLRDAADIAAAVEKYRAMLAGSLPDKRLAGVLKKVLDIERSANAAYNATIEKNLAAPLIYWYDTLLCAPGQGKFVCSGNIKRREYLFCLLAADMGVDVMILLPGGDISLPAALAAMSRAVILGECRDMVIPGFYPGRASGHADIPHRLRTGEQQSPPVSAAAGYTVNLSHPKRCPLGTSRKKAATSPVTPVTQVTPVTPVTQYTQPDSSRPHRQSGNTPVTSGNINRVSEPQRELTYEQLALLAESVVMIELEDGIGNVTGSGSGVAISRDGYILTNCHVAGHGSAYRVRLENDNNIYRTSSLIKYHPINDLALIRIDRPLKPLPVFDGKRELTRGQRVVAIGSPKGMFNSVSDGIIAGFRTIDDVDMIQFTAPISAGSSGGALLDMYGRLIGICTATLADSQNINIAVSCKQIIPFCGGFIK